MSEATSQGPTLAPTTRTERLGIVSFTNVAPLNWGLKPSHVRDDSPQLVYGVPTELNAALESGEIDLTLISSIELIRHRDRYKALLDFSIATLGPVYSVMLFHRPGWFDLAGAKVAVTTESATSVELLSVLMAADAIEAQLLPVAGSIDEMLAGADAALLIGDAALRAAVRHLPPEGGGPVARGVTGMSALDPGLHVTDLGEAWYRLTRLPFTFAVWASRDDNPPSQELVASLRCARTAGLGSLRRVADVEARRLGLPHSVVQRYLENFRYYLEPPDMDGLNEFAVRSDPTFKRGQLRFWER